MINNNMEYWTTFTPSGNKDDLLSSGDVSTTTHSDNAFFPFYIFDPLLFDIKTTTEAFDNEHKTTN